MKSGKYIYIFTKLGLNIGVAMQSVVSDTFVHVFVHGVLASILYHYV